MAHIEKIQNSSGKETIHSGHFMVSHFEAEAQDEYDDLAVPVPDEEQNMQKVSVVATYTVPISKETFQPTDKETIIQHQQLSIEISLTKLFKCMTLAYRQKLTSPKWNRFKGIKLRWKDKIRLNNVIWRCWHMQFIKKKNTLVCQFASPLDVDTHVKPETTILEGKYWKRRAEAVIAEYKKWRMFHITRLLGKGDSSGQDFISEMDTVESCSQYSEMAGNMLTDEDYLNFMSDTLFSTISSHQPFAFPDPREIARGASLADFIQPSLGPLQPNLDDFMDTLEPLQDLLSVSVSRLPPVPEESTLHSEETMYRTGMSVDSYGHSNYLTAGNENTGAINMPTSQMSIHGTNNNTQLMSMPEQSVKNEQLQIFVNGRSYTPVILPSNINTQEIMQPYPSTYEQSTDQLNMFAQKGNRLNYGNTPKLYTQPEPTYNKINAAIPPSQSAPETVSLLQQPVPNTKYTPSLVIQGRNVRENKRAGRNVAHYTNLTNSYQSYGQQHQAVSSQNVQYDTRQGNRHSPQQLQYHQANVEGYNQKQTMGGVESRSFKMPSPTLPAANTQHALLPNGRAVKEQYRSHSLPIGAQLNTDWTMSTTGPPPPQAIQAPSPTTSDNYTQRSRETAAHRTRSRSTSNDPSSSSNQRRPPPLTTAISEPAIPHGSLALAQLLHSQSMYKLNNTVDEAASSSDLNKSPLNKSQHSPIGSDVMSPHQCTSPPVSPGSEGSGREARRQHPHSHMHAEQKRRYNIKHGFDTLQNLIPHLTATPGAKISKAAMLQKGAEYIKQLKAERNQVKEEMEGLRQQIDRLNNSISNCHSLLPATGAPVGRARAGRLREMFTLYVQRRALQNWKYWLLSVISAGLLESFSSCVSCGCKADLVRTTLLWAEQHCSLSELRPAVLNSLRSLCTTTDILTNPERLPEEAKAAIATSTSVKTEPS